MDLDQLLDAQGFFSRAQAVDAGTTDKQLQAGVRAGTWHRYCHGYYTCADRWRGLDPAGRHLLRGDTALHQMPGAVALSHVTGALVHGLAVWGTPLDLAHVTRLSGGAARRANGVVHHHGIVGDTEVVTVRGRPCLPPARCALETAMLIAPEAGLVVLDSALHEGLATVDDLLDLHGLMERWPRSQALRRLVAMASDGAASPGESRTRWHLRRAGLPDPVLQYEVWDGSVLVATCDMAWPDLGVILEFDGREKYERHRAPGTSAGDVVRAEKEREDKVRALTGFLVVRVVWADLYRPELLARRVREAMARHAAATGRHH